MGWSDRWSCRVSEFSFPNVRESQTNRHPNSVSALELLYLYKSDWESAVAEAERRLKSEDISGEFKTSRI